MDTQYLLHDIKIKEHYVDQPRRMEHVVQAFKILNHPYADWIPYWIIQREVLYVIHQNYDHISGRMDSRENIFHIFMNHLYTQVPALLIQGHVGR